VLEAVWHNAVAKWGWLCSGDSLEVMLLMLKLAAGLCYVLNSQHVQWMSSSFY